MNIPARPLADVTHDAIHILSRELGIVDTIRFLNQFGAGHGNCTQERTSLFEDATLEDLIEEAKRLRSKPSQVGGYPRHRSLMDLTQAPDEFIAGGTTSDLVASEASTETREHVPDSVRRE